MAGGGGLIDGSVLRSFMILFGSLIGVRRQTISSFPSQEEVMQDRDASSQNHAYPRKQAIQGKVAKCDIVFLAFPLGVRAVTLAWWVAGTTRAIP